jgi:hypothetical protein
MAKRSWRYLVIALVALLVFPASMATADDPPSTPPERVYKVDAHLEEYVSGHLELEDWHKVSYLGISDRLTEILGAKYGVALDRVFQKEFRTHSIAGDKFPGVLVAPDSLSALALFFHADDTITVVTLSRIETGEGELGDWEVLDVKTEEPVLAPTF